MAAQHGGLGKKVSWHLGNFQSQQIFHLRQRNQHGNAIGESHDDADRHITHQRSELEKPHQKQQDPGAGGGNQQIGDAVALNNAVDDHDESAGRPANLHRRAAQGRNQRAGDDGGPDACLGLQPGRDGKRHGQGQGHNADRQPGPSVFDQPRKAVAR